MTAIDPDVLRRLGVASIQPHQVPMPQREMSDEERAEVMRRLADEEAYKRTLNKVQLAHNLIVSPVFHETMKADAHATNEDRDLARGARRAALVVLKSYLEADS